MPSAQRRTRRTLRVLSLTPDNRNTSEREARLRGILLAAAVAVAVMYAAACLRAEAAVRPAHAGPAHTFTVQGDHFLLDGKPFVIRSGEMHYPRVPRADWRDRMRKMKAMGLNTLCTYVFWDLHEPKPGKFDFGGNLDVAAFVRTAQEEGLWVLVRPGPYICTEWDWGGFPAWLLATPDMRVRSTDPRFLAASAAYMKAVGRQLAPLQITHGGPILMAQVENEYGSYGSDKTYLNAIRRQIRDAGFDVTLYTSDGPGQGMLNGGTLPDVLSVINFGAGNPAPEFAEFAKFRQGVPRMCGEFWIGWFDHWGERHHRTSAEAAARGVDWMLSQGISFNLYMAHGGTSWGFMSGANWGGAYQPDISSYDYDSPLDEAGRPTPKFDAIRAAISKHLAPGETLLDLPAPQRMLSVPRFTLRESAGLFASLPKPVHADRPLNMEALGQSYGFTLYRHRLSGESGAQKHATLTVEEPRDYALVCQGGRVLGTLDRRQKQTTLEVDLDPSKPLDILVENMGRINFGHQLVGERKGITERVTLDGRELTGWDIYPLPMDPPARLRFSESAKPGPAFYRGAFDYEPAGEASGTFLDMRGWGKGCVWVNGRNLGRYWHIGPQQTLFVPASWLKPGANEVVVLDLEQGGARTLAGLTDPVYEPDSR